MSEISEEKYKSELGYRKVQLRRLVIRQLIRGLTKWEPLPQPTPGYTVIVGCNAPLVRMISCNLRFLQRQELGHLDKILLVLDRPRDQLSDDVEPVLRRRFSSLPLEFLYYDRKQYAVCRLIGWPWVQSWLSWSMGIGRVRSKHALLHDFDAMLIRPDLLEERYRFIHEAGHQYVGVRYYSGNGVVAEDHLAATFELMFDAQYVRHQFEPLTLFNQVTRYKGRRVDFDTFLYAQTLAGTPSILPIPLEDMVHPSQLICQFEDFRIGRRQVPALNNLLLVPYFLHAGDEPQLLRVLTEELERNTGTTVQFFGKPLDITGLSQDHVRWITKQAFIMEKAIAGVPRAEVRRYFAAIDQFIARALGRELALAAGAE